MLKQLHRKLVAIIMVLVGTMIIALLSMTFISAQSSYTELSNMSLNNALEQRSDEPQFENENAPSDAGHIGVVWVDITTQGVMLANNQDQVAIDSESLEAVISEALESTANEGTLAEYHVMWKKTNTPFGLRIAMVDTTNIDANVKKLILRTLAIGAIAFAGLFALANFLATWALKPVAKAWEQQHQFVADASHELKTPLAVILANTEILKKDESNIPEADHRWIDSCADEAARMRRLVEELLELARTEEGAGSARRDIDVDFSDIVEGEAMQFDAVAFEKSCTIDTQISEGLHVKGDPDQLERLVKTLIDNACKYAAKHSTIQVNLTKNSTYAEFNVINQGTPIDEEDLQHVFDRFYRSDKARARETGGFGLGLAIARGICESHKGKIKATSSADAGTCFTVRLPLSTQKG